LSAKSFKKFLSLKYFLFFMCLEFSTFAAALVRNVVIEANTFLINLLTILKE
jgi:hypothetical protein